MKQVSTGFTLMELMIVLALAAVILAIGAPSFTAFRDNNRLTNTANDFLAATHLARTEAIKRQRPVALCPSADPGNPAATCSGGAFTGWIVFDDTDNDCDRDVPEEMLRGNGPLDSAVSTRSNGVCLSFAATGFLQPAAIVGRPIATQTVFCDARGLGLLGGTNQSAGRGIGVQLTGRPQVTRDVPTVTGWGLACP